MHLLSSAHQAWRDRAVDFVERTFSLEGIAPKAKHHVPAPRQAIDYIANMGGMDRNDQLRAYHTCTRKSNVWWKQLVYFLVDICRVNAYICHSHGRRKSMRQQDFIYDVAEALIDGYACGQDPSRRHHASKQNTRMRPVPVHNTPVHRLELLSGKKEWGKSCVACKNAGRTCRGRPGKPIVTKWGCRACGAHFCHSSKNRECFASYHSAGHLNVAE